MSSFIVTVRARQARGDGKQRWEVIKRFDAPDTKVAVEKAFESLKVNESWSVTIMRKREAEVHAG